MLRPTIDSVARIGKDKSEQVEKNGIMWWWCDALFMAPPTLAKLVETTGDRSYLDLSDRLFQETYDRLYNKGEHLYARDASYLVNEKGEGKHEANGKKVFWSRGNGWVAGGLARVLSELPANYPKRQFYLKQYQELVERVAGLQ